MPFYAAYAFGGGAVSITHLESSRILWEARSRSGGEGAAKSISYPNPGKQDFMTLTESLLKVSGASRAVNTSSMILPKEYAWNIIIDSFS